MTEQTQQALEAQGKSLAGMLDSFRQFELKTPEHHAWACSQLVAVKAQAKAFDEQKKQATAPMNAALKAVRSWFVPVEKPLEILEGILKEKIGTYERAEKAKQQQALTAAATEFQAGRADRGLALLQAVPERAVEKQAGISTRPVIKFRITNPTLVPREYCAPVDALIRAQVSVTGLETQIPGVEVYEEQQVIVRAG